MKRMTLLLILLLSLTSQPKAQERYYVNATLSFDCVTRLVLDSSGFYFASQSCKGFAHLSRGTWATSNDSILHLTPNPTLTLIDSVVKEANSSNKCLVVLRNYAGYPTKLYNDYEVKVEYQKHALKKPLLNQYSALDSLVIDPKQVKSIEVSFYIRSEVDKVKITVKPRTKILIYLNIYPNLLGYRGNTEDHSFDTLFYIREDGLYDEDGNKSLKPQH